MELHLWVLPILALLLQNAECQTYLDVASCIGPLTTAPSCNFYASKLDQCNSFTGSQAASCYCPQSVFNAIAGYVLPPTHLDTQCLILTWLKLRERIPPLLR